MFKERVERIQSALEPGQALLVTGDTHRYYFTGFHSSAGSVLFTPDETVFLIDFRYYERAAATVDGCRVQLCKRLFAEVGEICAAHGVKELFVEANVISVSRLAAIRAALPDLTVSDSNRFDGMIEEMRTVKNEKELSLIREAQRMTDETFSYILGHIAPGRSERDIMLDMEFFMRRMGSEGVSFDFIVVSGKNSSLPHGEPTDKLVEAGDFITMDFGAVVGGYHSDMTRTIAVGSATDEMRFVYDTVLKAQLEAEKAVRAGAVCHDIDKIARDIINAAGYEGCFGHGLGHSVGVEIHESPAFSPNCETVLRAGTVMTIEPGIYLENKFGVRIEDMVYVTEEGSINLTASPKNLIIL